MVEIKSESSLKEFGIFETTVFQDVTTTYLSDLSAKIVGSDSENCKSQRMLSPANGGQLPAPTLLTLLKIG